MKTLNNLIFTTYWTFEFQPGKNQKIAILATGAKLNLMCNVFSNTVFSLRFSRGITPYQNYWKPSIIWVLRRTELLSFYLEKTKKLPFWPPVQNLNLMCNFFSNTVFSLIFSRGITPYQKVLKTLNNLTFKTYWTFEFLPGKNQKIAILATGAKLNLMCNVFSNTVFSLRFSRGITPYQNCWKPSIIWFLRRTELLSFNLKKTKKLPGMATGAKLNLMCKIISNTVFSLIFSRGITPYQNHWKPSIIWFLRRTELLSFYLEKTKKLPFWPRVQNWIWCAMFFQILFFLKI